MGFRRAFLTLLLGGSLLCRLITGKVQKREIGDEDSWESINFLSEERPRSNFHEGKFHLINNMNISLQKKLSEIKDKDEFAKFFGVLSLRSRSSLSSTPSEGVEAVNAGCTPLPTPVSLSLPPGPTDAYFPSCVLLERCGGCCFGDLLTCQPMQTEEVKLKVMKLISVPSETTRSRRETTDTEVIVTEKQHLKCACQCTVKEKDCNPQIQSYNANECKCQCLDRNSETACLQKDSSHFWNLKNCACLCRKVLECSTGETFDHVDCRCKKMRAGSSSTAVSFNSVNG